MLDLKKLEQQTDDFIEDQTEESYNRMFAEMDVKEYNYFYVGLPSTRFLT